MIHQAHHISAKGYSQAGLPKGLDAAVLLDPGGPAGLGRERARLGERLALAVERAVVLPSEPDAPPIAGAVTRECVDSVEMMDDDVAVVIGRHVGRRPPARSGRLPSLSSGSRASARPSTTISTPFRLSWRIHPSTDPSAAAPPP